jgi:hypothetical protein
MPSPVASVAFCAFGGQGVLGPGMRPEDYVRVIAVVDVSTPAGSAQSPVTVASIALRNEEGVVEATMRGAPITVARVEPIPAVTTWAAAIDTPGSLFDGTLAPGRTRLRIEAWLTTHPRSPHLRVHVALGGGAGSIEADGAVDGEWPTA